MNFTATGILGRGLRHPRDVSTSINKEGFGPGKGGGTAIGVSVGQWSRTEGMGHGAALEAGECSGEIASD